MLEPQSLVCLFLQDYGLGRGEPWKTLGNIKKQQKNHGYSDYTPHKSGSLGMYCFLLVFDFSFVFKDPLKMLKTQGAVMNLEPFLGFQAFLETRTPFPLEY